LAGGMGYGKADLAENPAQHPDSELCASGRAETRIRLFIFQRLTMALTEMR
jgi:hypothetical protein